jgi:hypothetical protein
VAAFYEEYYHTSLDDYDEDTIAKRTTFSNAYHEISEDGNVCRMMRGKGNFSTCNICNNAARLLANKGRKLSKADRELVQQYR